MDSENDLARKVLRMASQLSKDQPVEVDPYGVENMNFDRLLAIGQPIRRKTARDYGPALDSYLDFVIKHQKPVEPTPDTLSFYVVYMNSFIGPSLTDKYLTEVVSQLKPYFPGVRRARMTDLVTMTLLGCYRRDVEMAPNASEDEEEEEEAEGEAERGEQAA